MDVESGEVNVRSEGVESMSLQHRVLSSVLEETLAEFRIEMKEEIQNMHLEILRQFQIQKVLVYLFCYFRLLILF